MIEGLHHISIIASSEKTVGFYAELGFEETFRKKRTKDIIVFMEGYGLKLVLFIDGTHPKRDMQREQLGVRCFALKVDDIEAMAKKYDCGPINKDWEDEKYCFMKDPDGLLIELHE